MISSIDFPFVINAVSSDCPLNEQTEANPKREKDTGDATKAIVINNCPPNISFFFFSKKGDSNLSTTEQSVLIARSFLMCHVS